MAQIWEPEWDAKTGQWKVNFSVKGQRIRRRLGIRDRGSKALARKEAKRLHDKAWKLHFAEPEAPQGTPFWRAAEAYVQSGGEARFLPPLIRHFGQHTMCEEIGQVEIVECATETYPGRARSTIRRQVETPISAVLRFARGERRRDTGDNPRTDWLSPDEAERLLTACDARTRRMVAFLLGSGCRTGEMFAAQAFDYSAGVFRIRGEQEGAGKSRAATRTVRMPSRAIDLIGETPNAGGLFLTPKGLPYKMRVKGGGQMAATFNKARDAAGLGSEITPHVLRHTFATWHYAQNKDLILLMAEGGWSRTDMVLRYTKLAAPGLSDRLLSYGWDFRRDSGPVVPLIRTA